MCKRNICLVALFLITSFSAIAHEGRYVIQLAAVKNLDLANYKPVEKYGEITVSKTGNNINRVQIGAFKSIDDAKSALKKIRSKGFGDAFILQEDGHSLPVKTTEETDYSNPVNHPRWKNLTAEQQNNVVILDGKLHLKEADKFIPLDNLK